MFASYIKMKIKFGKLFEMIALTRNTETQIRDIGMKQFWSLAKGTISVSL